jgi:putative FmdB family regulatory protein
MLFRFNGVPVPIYEYQCQACGEELEKIQKMSADPLVVCPACDKPELKKKISAAGFRLKGSGWYETDFKGGSKKKEVAESSPPSAKAAPAKKNGGSCCGGSGNHSH